MHGIDFHEHPPLPELHSERGGGKVERLYALLTIDEKGEGVVRRETPVGPQAFITDDPGIAEALLAYVKTYHFPKAKLVVFRRER